MISFKEAQDLLKSNKIEFGVTSVPLENALNKILAEDVFADRDYPPFNRAAMDGFAVSSEWYNALENKIMPNQGTLLAGKEFLKEIDISRSLRIMTGAAVPDGLDAIIKIEDAHADCDMVRFESPKNINKGLNIAKKGEDVRAGEIILKKHAKLNAQNIQALATIGKTQVSVFEIPKVGLITTGDEVVSLETVPNNFQIRNSNLWSIKVCLENLGIDLIFQKQVSDEPEILERTIKEALPLCDILLLTGGVSMGDADFVPQILSTTGVENVFHKVAIKPGKPIWFGRSTDKLVFGLPGNPLSAFLDLQLFVLPILIQSQQSSKAKFIKGILAKDQKSASIDRFIPFYFKNGEVESKVFNGSGDITALVETDGFIYLKSHKTYQQGEVVEICLF